MQVLIFLLLIALAFMDRHFKHSVIYLLIFNLLLSWIAFQKDPILGLVVLVFSAGFLPAISWWLVKRTEKRDVKRRWVPVILILLPIIWILKPPFDVLIYSLFCILLSANLLKAFFGLAFSQASLLYCILRIATPPVSGLMAEIFLELATFLPLLLLAYLTLELYRKYRNLSLWSIW